MSTTMDALNNELNQLKVDLNLATTRINDLESSNVTDKKHIAELLTAIASTNFQFMHMNNTIKSLSNTSGNKKTKTRTPEPVNGTNIADLAIPKTDNTSIESVLTSSSSSNSNPSLIKLENVSVNMILKQAIDCDSDLTTFFAIFNGLSTMNDSTGLKFSENHLKSTDSNGADITFRSIKNIDEQKKIAHKFYFNHVKSSEAIKLLLKTLRTNYMDSINKK